MHVCIIICIHTHICKYIYICIYKSIYNTRALSLPLSTFLPLCFFLLFFLSLSLCFCLFLSPSLSLSQSVRTYTQCCALGVLVLTQYANLEFWYLWHISSEQGPPMLSNFLSTRKITFYAAVLTYAQDASYANSREHRTRTRVIHIAKLLETQYTSCANSRGSQRANSRVAVPFAHCINTKATHAINRAYILLE